MGLRIVACNKDNENSEHIEIFDGAYSAFFRLRSSIIESIGGELLFTVWYWRKDHAPCEHFNRRNYPALYEFMCHSDCDGIITPYGAGILSNEFNKLMPYFKNYEHQNLGGHLSNLTFHKWMAEMADNLQEASKKNLTVYFE